MPETNFKIRTLNLAKTEFQETKFPDCLGKFLDFQRSLSDSLSLPGFPEVMSGNSDNSN